MVGGAGSKHNHRDIVCGRCGVSLGRAFTEILKSPFAFERDAAADGHCCLNIETVVEIVSKRCVTRLPKR